MTLFIGIAIGLTVGLAIGAAILSYCAKKLMNAFWMK